MKKILTIFGMLCCFLLPLPVYALWDVNLTIESTGNGSVSFNGTTIRNESKTFTVEDASGVTLTFTPDAGCQLLNVNTGNLNMTSAVTNNSLLVIIMGSTTVSVTFSGVPADISTEGMKYTVSSYNNKTVSLAKGNYGPVLKVPATFEAEGATWTVTGTDAGAFNDSPNLAAIIWNPAVPFTEKVSNPNLLLYVNDAEYAPSTIKNVVVNDVADNIILTDAASGNDFYCPKEFTAKQISYTHHYSMTTGIQESRGWETIALPFDVDKVEHSTKGAIVPFANWNSSSSAKPFWLYEYGVGGFREATSIKANKPYIISMPNNEKYLAAYCLNGTVIFSSSNVTVRKTEDNITAYNGSMAFVPNFSNQTNKTLYYVLNVTNDYDKNSAAAAEGSVFMRNGKTIRPFEAYMTSSGRYAKPYIAVFEDVPTGIDDATHLIDHGELIIDNDGDWYSVSGQKLSGKPMKKGVYIHNGKKTIVR